MTQPLFRRQSSATGPSNSILAAIRFAIRRVLGKPVHSTGSPRSSKTAQERDWATTPIIETNYRVLPH